ncbi:MAG: glutamyl-tRNA reductase [Ginsengibacter sp.]
MPYQSFTNIENFFIVGINYKKTDASIRGQFAIHNEQYEHIIDAAASYNIKEFFVLSTCNRTEIYGFAQHADNLAQLLCSQTEGKLQDFMEMSYAKCGVAAIEHLFNVAAGLDSQILGDYEIIGQIKKSFKISKQRNCIGAYLERIVNGVLQASKKVRTTTVLSGGTVSVSFAAVQYIKEKFGNSPNKILLLGTGKIGSNTCKNIADYLPNAAVTLVNRTEEKARELSETFNFKFGKLEDLKVCINDADIILVATNANEPFINCDHFLNPDEKLVIDLSVPCNVSEDVKQLPHINLVNVDELSKIKDETLLKRSAEIPKVKLIIKEHVDDFLTWHQMRRHVPVLKNVKIKLLSIHADSTTATLESLDWCGCPAKTEARIQKVINGMAVKLKGQNLPGCHYIEAINDFISIGPGLAK